MSKYRMLDRWKRQLDASETCRLIVHSKTSGNFVGRELKRNRIPGMSPEKDLAQWEKDVKRAEEGLKRFLESRWEGREEFPKIEIVLS